MQHIHRSWSVLPIAIASRQRKLLAREGVMRKGEVFIVRGDYVAEALFFLKLKAL